jgi:hypothetical protein
MITAKRFVSLCSALLILGALLVALPAAWAQDDLAQQAIDLVSQTPEFADWLSSYDGWQSNAWQSDEENVWYVEFYDANWEEWLGYANVNIESGEIVDSFIPLPLPPEQYAEEQPRVQALVLDDAEVRARLVDPVLWYISTDYNRFDQVWEVYLSRGTQSLRVRAELGESYFSIQSIDNLNLLDEEDLQRKRIDQAINLAYGGAGIDEALAGYDDWRTYVEQQSENVFSVSFVSGERELFYALVNVATEEVLETVVGG